MADKAVFEIVVTDKGLKISQKNVDSLGNSVQRTTKNTKEASKAQDEFNYKLNQGTTGVSSAARSFSKLNQAIGNGPNGLVGAYATLAANAFAVSAGFNALREAAQIEQLMKGLEIQGNRTGVTLNQTAQSLVNLTNGALSAADSMKATALMSSAGLMKSDMEALTNIATDASVALGRNLPDAMDRITKGVIKLEPELLDELGLMTKLTEASETYARQNNKTASSLSRVEKSTAFLRAIQREGALKFGGIAEEAGVNPYDRLAASFSNLTKTVLGAINNFGPFKFIVDSLADSTYTLSGALILFASTISRSLMGSLYGMQEGLDRQANKLDRVAKKQRKATEETLAGTKANVEAARASLENPSQALDKRGANAFKADFAAMKDGTLTQERYQANLDKLTSSSNKFSKELTKLEEAQLQGKPTDIARIERLRAVIALREEQITQISRLKVAEAELAEKQKASASAIAEASLTETSTRKTAAASRGLEAAGNFQLIKSFKEIKTSVTEYSQELKDKASLAATQAGNSGVVAAGGLKKAWDAARVAGYSLRLSISAIGTTLLAALPYIGLAVTAISLLIDLWKKWTTTAAEEKIKQAYESLSASLDTIEGKLKEIDRLKTLDISTSQRTTKTLQIQANAIAEIGTAYEEVRRARERATEADAAEDRLYRANQARLSDAQQTQNTASAIAGAAGGGGSYYIDLAEQATQSRRELAEATNTLIDSDVTAWFDENRRKVDVTNESVVTTIRVLDTLARVDNRVAEEFRSSAAAAENQADVLRVADQVISKYTDASKSLAGALLSLTSSFESAELAQENFIKSISTTTVYDQSLTAIDALNQELGRTSRLLSRPEDTQKFAEMLGTLGPNLRETLNVETQEQLQNADALGDQYNTISGFLREHRDLLGDITEEGTQAYRLASEQKGIQFQIEAIYREQQSTIQQQLSDYADKLAQAQKESLVAQGRLAIAQAELEVMSRNGAITAQQMREQLQKQNEIKDLQASALRINIEFLQIEIEKEQAQLRRIVEEKNSIINQKQILDIMERQSIVMSSTLLDAEAAAIRQAQAANPRMDADTKSTQNARLVEIGAQVEKNTQILNGQGEAWEQYSTRALADLELERRAVNRTIEARQASITAIQQQAAAILMTKLSPDEINLRAQQITIANNRQELGLQNQISDLENQRDKALKDRTRIFTRYAETVITQFEEIITRTKAQITSLLTDSGAEIAELERQRDLQTDQGAKNLLQRQIDLLKQRYSISLELLDINYKNQLLEATSIDTLSKGLEIQRDSLKVVQDYLKIQEQINSQKAEQRSLDAQIAAKRLGTEVSPEVQRNLDILSARETLQAAEDSLAIKIEGINLEYALLEAQRLNSIFEYRLNKESLLLALQASGKSREEAGVMLGQMDAAISNLENMNYNRVRDLAVDSARREVDILQRRLVLAETRPLPGLENTGLPDLLSAINDFGTIISTRNATVSSQNLSVAASVTPNMAEARAERERQLQESISNLANKLSQTFLPTADQALSALTDLVQFIRNNETPGAERPTLNRMMAPLSQYTIGDRFESRGGRHNGVDLRTPVGSDVRAPFSGRVTFGNQPDSGGYFARVTDATGTMVTSMSHLSERFMALEGQMVQAGTVLGKSGGARGSVGAGNSTGPHVHWRMTVNGVNVDPLAQTTVPVSVETATEASRAGLSPSSPMLVRDVDRAAATANAAAAAPTTGAAAAAPTTGAAAAAPTTGAPVPAAANDNPTLPEINLEPAKAKFEDFWNFATRASQPLLRTLNSLGPKGEAQARAIQGVQALGTIVSQNLGSLTQSYTAYKAEMDSTNLKLKEQGRAQLEVTEQGKFQAQKLSEGFAVAAAVIGSVMSILKASSDARIAGIDKEIAAEQKRDGKSAASVEKINALEKKKDAAARKSFNTQKKLMMAQAVMSTAAGVTGALALLPNPMAIPLAVIVGAMGAAQLAIIAGTQYESSYTPKSVSAPSALSVGKRSDTVDLAKGPNANAGGEVGYLRGSEGTGSNASNYRTVGSAYGGELMRGYGNRGFVVGEKGPEVITPETPISVTPANDVGGGQSINASFSINAIDSQGVQDVLVAQKGNIIKMLREAANASGKSFMEDVNVNVYTRPSVGKL